MGGSKNLNLSFFNLALPLISSTPHPGVISEECRTFRYGNWELGIGNWELDFLK
jgi:hypothetical protein